jgi:uncharacterized integral membrane protein
MRIRIRVMAGIVVVGLLVTFALQNWQEAQLRFLGWHRQLPLSIICLTIYVLGMFTGWALFSFLGRSFRQATQNKPN